ncbi:acyltransferase family protein [Sphingomonas morindae]|uniref:Acyltransferase n=1 Tax=Sphingomonas morindae TaxID=1541170 RepID=A0ABY4X6Q2_9SPHN|nr:acyltransferase [Sphingomonas morindae]USI72588.1 acyltransferase [Sphingomonas morindae]
MSASIPIDTRQKFYGIDVVRGVATCMVALGHACYMQSEARFGGVAPFGGHGSGLFVCVDFFFVLSGFLIPWVHWNDFRRPARVARYFQRRFSRIYPVYWVVLTLFIGLHFLRPSTSHEVPLTLKTVLTSYFVIPNDGPTLMGVAWTLYYEIWGYLVFGALLLVGTRGFAAIIAWAAAIIALYAWAPPTSFPANFFMNPFNLEFLMGIGVAVVLRNVRVPAARPLAIGALALFLVLIYLHPGKVFHEDPLLMRLAMGGLASVAIAALIEWERTRAIRIPGWLMRFGAGSYSIYLVHTIVEGPLMSAGWGLWKHVSPEARAIAVAAVAIAIGYGFHKLVELPLTELVKRWVLREGRAKPVPAPAPQDAVPATLSPDAPQPA